MNLTISQLCLLRSIKKRGIPTELINTFLTRCGASIEEWRILLDSKHTFLKEERFYITQLGKKEYQKQKIGRYF